jgi:hypothetical protein
MLSLTHHISGELPETQLYALIVLENAGVDLESFEFDKTTGWKQAWGAVMQVVKTLAEGELKARFEVSRVDCDRHNLCRAKADDRSTLVASRSSRRSGPPSTGRDQPS